MADLVECRSDGEYAERPLALWWQGQRVAITEILASWRLPAGKRFRVRAADEQVYEITYAEPEDAWHIEPH